MKNPLRPLRRTAPRVRRLAQRLKNGTVGLGAASALQLSARVSLEHTLRLSEQVGALLYRVLRQPRHLALEHLQIAFGDELTPTARAHLARASFVNMARCFCELAKIDEIRARRDEYFEVDGEAHAEALRTAGQPAIIITGHIGNWELLAAYFAWRGFPVAAIARRIHAERINQLLVDLRRRHGVETILRESPHSARQILKALKDNSLLSMVIDKDPHAPSVSVPFFGRMARTPAAAAALAIRQNLPVTAAFIQRRDFGHRITVCPPFVIERSGDVRADIAALTRQFSLTFERQLRRNPAEWVWWHRRGRRARLPHLDLDRDFQYSSSDAVMRRRG
ncbi:MAG TPA: lysophospholipid acyltransferase family protein [Candidatus Margulisiibacteriota bacterium]|nr:lysophospholipid acyltransferase family protein [Candidatus Margulisiibacteriota bacterium]